VRAGRKLFPKRKQLRPAQTMTAAPAGVVALSGGCRSSRIRLAERTVAAGNTTAAKGLPQSR